MQRAGQPLRTDIQLIEATAHGISIVNNVPVPVFVDSGSSTITLADSTDSAKQKSMFVVKVIDANNLMLQQAGFLKAPAHGLAVGNYYYVDPANAGELTINQPAQPDFNDICLYVVSGDTLLLIDNRRI